MRQIACFVFILIYSQVVDCTSSCYNETLDSFINNTIYTGYAIDINGNSTIQTCISRCNSMRTFLQLPSNQAIYLHNDCLCLRQNVSALGFAAATQCSSSACDILASSCPVQPYSLVDLNQGVISVKWMVTSIEPLFRGQDWTVEIQAFPNNPGMEYTFDIGDEKQELVTNNNVVTAKGTDTSGYFLWKATVNIPSYSLPVVKTEFVYISDNATKVHFTHFSCLETNKPHFVSLYIASGTNLTVKVTNGNSNQETFKAIDINEGSVGLVDSTTNVQSISNGIFVVPSMRFSESGAITRILCNVARPGVISLLILRPVCGNNEIYSTSNRKCVSQKALREGIDLLTSRKYVVNSTQTWFTPPALRIVNHIQFEMKSTGKRTLGISNYALLVEKNDMVGYTQSANSGQMFFNDNITESGCNTLNASTEYQLGDEFKKSEFPGELKIPLLKLYYSKWFDYQMKVTPTSPGEYTMSATVQNPYSNDDLTTTKKYKVQDQITGLHILPGNPSDVAVDAHDIEKGSIAMKASVATGTEVVYMFTIRELQEQKSSKTGEAEFTIKDVGIYTVDVEAANLVNKKMTSRQFSVMSPIGGLYINVNETFIYKGNVVGIEVQVINGTNVTMEIDFGDGSTPFKGMISDATNGIQKISVWHNYTKCNMVNIQVRVKNRITIGQWEVFTSPYNHTAIIRVSCPFQNLQVESSPAATITKEIQLLPMATLSLKVELETGSFPVFIIQWGDGTNDTEDQSTNVFPQPFTRNHVYKINGTVNVTITATNGVDTLPEIVYFVHLVECIAPEMLFEYGTEDKRLMYFRKDKIPVVATWKIPKENSGNCTEIVNQQYNIKNWNLFRVNTPKPISQTDTGFQPKYQRVVYEIPAMQSPGEYNLILTMKYNDKEYAYNGYFAIKSSELVAKIHNEQFQSIASKEKRDGNLTFYNFHLNASESYDPDNVNMKTSGIEFRWQCRLISNETMTNYSMKVRNATSRIEFRCMNREWSGSVNITGVDLEFNTKYFLENIEYEFKVTITKGTRVSSASQIVLIAPGAPPKVDLFCSEASNNCGDKVNINNLLAFELDGCGKFPLNQMFSSVWTAHLDSAPSEDVIPPLIRTHATCYGHNLIVDQNTLKPSRNYTFILKFRYYQSTSEGIFKIKRRTSETPFGGKCEIVGSNNITAPSEITVLCKEWQSVDGPLEYQFYQRPEANSKGPLGIKSKNPTITFTPAVGESSSNYLNIISAVVLNRYKQSVEVNLDVFVRPATEKIDINSVLDKIPTDNPQEIANAVIMLTTATSSVPDMSGTTKVNEEEGDYGDISIEKKTPEEQEKEKEEQKQKEKQLESLASAIKSSIGNNTDVNIDALGASANAIKVISSNPDASGGDALDTCTDAVDLISSRAAALFPNSDDNNKDDNIGREKINEFANTMTKVLSTSINAVNNAAKLSIETVQSTIPKSQEEKQQQIKENQERQVRRTASVRNGVHTLASALADNQISGEEQKQIETDQLDLYVMKVSSPNALSNTSFDSGNSTQATSGFVISNASNIFGLNGRGKPVKCIGVTYKTDMFPGIEGSENIASYQPSLQFVSEGQELRVNDTEEPIIVKIKNKPEKLKPENITMYMPGKITFHTIEVKSTCNLLMNIKALNDLENKTILHVYIQYGKPPSTTDHDIKLTLTQSTNLTMIVNKEDVLFNQTVFIKNSTTTTTAANLTEGLFLPRKSNAILTSDNTLVLWDFSNFTYSHKNISKLYLGLTYEGKMPPLKTVQNPYTYDILEYRGEYNYSLISFCAKCSFVYVSDSSNASWSDRGCKLKPEETSLSRSVCECNHLTTFGSFFVAPNPLKPPSLAMLKDGYVLLVTVATILLLYLIGLIFTRRADKADTTKIGVSPLPDNRPEDKYLYEITVNTGSRRHAGTGSNVFFSIAGDLDESGTRCLKDTRRRTFQRSSSDVFVMATSSSLGDISYIRIWHDNSCGGWYLRSVEIIDLQTERKFVFIASRWLAVEQGDGQIEVMLPLSGQLEMKDFNYIFASKSRRDLSDAHLWFSIYARPPRSPFTRTQRLSVAISLLFTAMTASCLFYGAIPQGDPASENRIGSFSFKWQQVYVAIVSACITIPINVLLVGLFRSVRPYTPPVTAGDNQVTSNESFEINDDDELVPVHPESPSNQHLIHEGLKKKDSTHIDIEIKTGKRSSKKQQQKQKGKKKEPFYLPHCVIYPTWVLCISVILGSAFMVVWYGMNFGNKKSLEWLASVSISLVQDILLIQPLKVFLVALFVALVVKKLDDEERSVVEKQVKNLAKNESWLHQFTKAEGTIFDRADSDVFEPPKNEKLQQMKQIRLKELKMKAISREIMLYLFFTCIVFLLGFMTRDYQAYHQTLDLEELMKLKTRDNRVSKQYREKFPFKKTGTKEIVWEWLEEILLPELYPTKWFNVSKRFENNSGIYDFPGRIYLNDLNSKVVTGVRLRQVRVIPYSCQKAKKVRDFISNDCLGYYDTSTELKKDFAHNWSIPHVYDISMNPRDMPWRYQSWSDLDGYPIMAELDTYYGGGYVVELFPKWDNKKILKTLKEKRWLDRQTRAVLVEFSIYNGNTNYFDSVSIVFEFPPGGGVIHYHYVCTFKLYRYTNQYAFFTILCEALFVIFMLLFTVREARVIYRERWSYFKEFWNLVEFSNIILSILAVTFYFYRDVLANRLLSRLPDKQPNVFINLQFAGYWDLVFTYIVALICFFVTLKFIKLLRFNRRISMLSSTLKRAWYPLMMFGILFGIVLMAVTMSATIIFGKALYGYRDNFKTFSSIISLLLGKFSYNQFDSTNRVLGPIFFFAFNIMVNWVIMNMYISILNDVLSEVHEDVKSQDNDYEMVDYMVNSLKGWFGIQNQTNEEMLQASWQKNKEEEIMKERKNSRKSRLRHRQQQQSQHSNRSMQSLTSLRKAEIQSEYSTTPEYSSYVGSKVFNTDITFLTAIDDDEMDERLIKETLEKFVKCVSILNDEGYNDIKKKKMK